ncbi:MAG: TetR/AcrR family transcriptional regulator [Allorhizobium sp.]
MKSPVASFCWTAERHLRDAWAIGTMDGNIAYPRDMLFNIRRMPPFSKRRSVILDSVRRKPRSDALRNRDRLIEAAKKILGRGGPEASLEAVAREAGVGIGTLYRHFPTREALFHAVYRYEVDGLIAMTAELEKEADVSKALRLWVHALVALVETKRGLLGTLAVVATEDSKAMFVEMSGRLNSAVGQLLENGVGSGTLRSDITAEDLLSTIYAVCYTRPAGPDWKAQVLRIVDTFLDGMKAR